MAGVRVSGKSYGPRTRNSELGAWKRIGSRARFNELSSSEFRVPSSEFSSPRHLRDARFAQDRHLDLAGIGQLLLERACDVVANLGGRGVGRSLGVRNHAHLAAGLNRKGLIDAGKAGGDGFQLFHPLDV